MRKVLEIVIKVLDPLLALLLIPSAWYLKMIRTAGTLRLPLCKKVLLGIGVYPIRDHYYEPQFDFREMRVPLKQDRNLPGIDMNDAGQLALLKDLTFASEIDDLDKPNSAGLQFHWDNPMFLSGDVEFLYQIIRAKKPKRLVEIGSGNSTLIAMKAIAKNVAENAADKCEHVCVEPYESPWLEKADVQVIRKRVELLDMATFASLEPNDILFIDSSHMVRPDGDVLFEFLEILPNIKPGVIVHVHDIWTPKNYQADVLEDEVKFWNEQYILEAFLTENPHWKVIGALSYLHHHHYEELKKVAPRLTPQRDPGSFWMQRVS